MVMLEGKSLDLAASLSKEWLETNGLGGYASSTLANCHTRKYHGFLVSRLAEPGGRYVLLSKLEDSLSLQGREYYLTIHKYPMILFPEEPLRPIRFDCDLFPRFTYQIDDVVIEKELFLVYGEDTLLIRYALHDAPHPLPLKIKPFIAFRGIHELSHENSFLKREVLKIRNGVRISPYDGMPDLFMMADDAFNYTPSNYWYKNFEYTVERERGFPFREDLFMPGVLEYKLGPGDEIIFCVSLEEKRDIKKNQGSRDTQAQATQGINSQVCESER